MLDFLDEAQCAVLEKQAANQAMGQQCTYELTFRRPDGADRQVMITAAPRYDAEHHFLGSFEIFRDITESKKREEQLVFMSTRDTLTGLHNRAFFDETLARLQRSALTPISVIMLDVDHLKPINDTLGHAAGDELLRRSAQVLLNSFRSDDVVARIGGDEFVVLLPGATAEVLQAGIHRLQNNLTLFNQAHGEFTISLSMGGATANQGEDLAEVVRTADQAMYREKIRKRS